MSRLIERRSGPSLLVARSGARAGDAPGGGSLVELMHDGFYLLFMLRAGASATGQLLEHVKRFLAEVERQARSLRVDGDDVEMAKYAYCAALDEIMLGSAAARGDWECRPLQLVLFGDQLAGEHFFDRLEALRGKGAVRLQALQVFHLCLLLGFKGKYANEQSEKLSYLTARLSDEIAHLKGKSRGFAPRAERPDQIVNRRGGELPLWAPCCVFALLALCAYLGMKTALTRSTAASLAGYADLVKLAPRPASLVITLP